MADIEDIDWQYVRELTGSTICAQSVFISHSRYDYEVASRINDYLRYKNIQTFLAEQDMNMGQLTVAQLQHEISIKDRLLLVLSENSIRSPWVKAEIKWAVEKEIGGSGPCIFPIALIPFADIKKWSEFDCDSGIDLAARVREFHIDSVPDPSSERDFDVFCAKLVVALTKGKRTQPGTR